MDRYSGTVHRKAHLLQRYGDGVEKVGLPGAEEEALPDAA